MSFIYVLNLKPHYKIAANWDENSNHTIESHFLYLKSLNERGIVRFVGRTDYAPDHPDLFGICVLNVDDFNKASEIMEQDHAVKLGIMEAKMHPFKTIFSN